MGKKGTTSSWLKFLPWSLKKMRGNLGAPQLNFSPGWPNYPTTRGIEVIALSTWFKFIYSHPQAFFYLISGCLFNFFLLLQLIFWRTLVTGRETWKTLNGMSEELQTVFKQLKSFLASKLIHEWRTTGDKVKRLYNDTLECPWTCLGKQTQLNWVNNENKCYI